MKENPSGPTLTDTSDAAAEVQARVFREMPAWRKVALVEDANRTARVLALAGIGLRFPGASEEQRFRRLMDIELGEELALRVYGPIPPSPGR